MADWPHGRPRSCWAIYAMAATIPNREEKLKNAVCFFASEHERLTHKPLAHTFLYKYLAFLDFASLEKTGCPALGLLYRALGGGPVPIPIHGERDMLRNECFIFVPLGGGMYVVKASGEADLGCFSPFEVNEMRRLVDVHSRHFAREFDASAEGRKAAGSWKRIRGIRKNASIGYDDVFDRDFFSKHEEVYTMSSLHLLIEKYVDQLKELETRMADLKHKLEIVMEASRLLAEEGLSDDGPSGLSHESRLR